VKRDWVGARISDGGLNLGNVLFDDQYHSFLAGNSQALNNIGGFARAAELYQKSPTLNNPRDSPIGHTSLSSTVDVLETSTSPSASISSRQTEVSQTPRKT
jgi:hypothetical protein